jgi:hypothetical protein
MDSPIEALVNRWGSNEYHRINKLVVHLERWLFYSYEPDKFHGGDFWVRLGQWLDNVPQDEDKKLLLRLLTELIYLGPAEFEELYRCAYEGPIARWLIDREGIDVFAPDAQKKLKSAAAAIYVLTGIRWQRLAAKRSLTRTAKIGISSA